MKKIIYIFTFFLISCSDPSEWYPLGEITILSHRLYINENEKLVCKVNYEIKNTGKSKISTSIISFKISTDQDDYYYTTEEFITILPENSIYKEYSQVLLNQNEILSNISVLSNYFE